MTAAEPSSEARDGGRRDIEVSISSRTILLVVVQAMSDAVRRFSADLPQILDEVRRSDLGKSISGGSDPLATVQADANYITKGVGKVSGGCSCTA